MNKACDTCGISSLREYEISRGKCLFCGDLVIEKPLKAQTEPVAEVPCSVGLAGLVDKWQEQSEEMYSKAKNWIEIPSDARFLGKAEAIRQCILELQVELRKAD